MRDSTKSVDGRNLILVILLSLTVCYNTSIISPSVLLDSRTSSSLEVKFETFSSTNEGDVIGYEISKKSLISSDWEVINDKYTLLSGWNQYEQQIVAVKVDSDHNLWKNGGSFMLGIVRDPLNPLNADDETSRTPSIPWNADEKTF